MRRQARPVIVEVKRKRGAQERGRSIWGGIDLSAVAAGMTDAASLPPDHPLVDSGARSSDLESVHKSQMEQQMADPRETGTVLEDISEGPSHIAEKPEPTKRTPRMRTGKVEPKQRAAKNTGNPASGVAREKRKIHSEKERAEKLARIAKAVGDGASIKSAVNQVGISEQTYYQWKKTVATAPSGDALKDLVALEAENERLKKMLADRLRKENAELKKKLGLE